jgi:hypothetical protein
MPRTWTSTIVLLLAVGTDAMAQRSFKVVKQIPRNQRTTSPTFDGLSVPRIVDRGRMLVIGRGLFAEHHLIYLLRLSDRTPLTVRAPVAELVAREESFAGVTVSGHPLYSVSAVLYYDTGHQQAGLLYSEGFQRSGAVRKHYLLQWDLAQRRISHAVLLAQENAGVWTMVQPIAYDPQRRELSVLIVNVEKGKPSPVKVVGVVGSQQRTIAQLTTARSISADPAYDAPRRRVLLIEYAELPVEGAAPRGTLIDLVGGKQTSFEVPVTTYGAEFDADGKTIYLYSSQLGKLVAIDGTSGKVRREAAVGTHGHALGFVGKKSTLLVLRNSGLQLVDARRLVKQPMIPMRRLFSGFSHVEGSLITRDLLVIKNGALLYLVEVK